ncbi:MAG: hypothetical protein ACLQE9_11780, partial [Roseiarcus sp.]
MAVKDARRAPPKAARSVLDGHEHDGIVTADGRKCSRGSCHPHKFDPQNTEPLSDRRRQILSRSPLIRRRAVQARIHAAANTDSSLTVADALEAYFADREQRGSKGLAKDRAAARARILPELGAIELVKLTTKRIRDWQSALATAPKLARAPRTEKSRKVRAVDMMDVDAVRARRATANRTLTVLKAALNHAFREGRVASDDAWRKVKPFREADAPVVHFLSDDECRRIVNVCGGGF